jgi:hypothetical protein
MLVQQMSLNNKPTPVSGKFVIGFLSVMALGILGIYILKKTKDTD